MIFLKVDVDKCQETAVSCGVKAMPTFVFYRNKVNASERRLLQFTELLLSTPHIQKEIDRLQGADLNGLIGKIQQNIGPDDQNVSAFSGKGHTLGRYNGNNKTLMDTW